MHCQTLDGGFGFLLACAYTTIPPCVHPLPPVRLRFSVQLSVLRRALDMCEQGSDIPLPDLAVLLAVCKLIDLLALLPLENFHLYVCWMPTPDIGSVLGLAWEVSPALLCACTSDHSRLVLC